MNIHIGERDAAFAVVSRAPLKEIEPFKKRIGWQFKWASSFDTDFNFDFNVSFAPFCILSFTTTRSGFIDVSTHSRLLRLKHGKNVPRWILKPGDRLSKEGV